MARDLSKEEQFWVIDFGAQLVSDDVFGFV
jgi:hypothetical protein